MTISSTDDPRAGPFNGNGSQTAFPFEFKAFAEEDLLVVQTDEDGLETTLVLDSDYTVTLNADQNADPGGTVTAMVAPPTGETLTIASNLEFTQETDITNGGGFYPEVLETALDRNTMLVKQVNEKVNRALRVAVSTPDDVSVELPAPSAQKIIGWNDAATGLVNRDIGDFATVVAFAAWQSQTFDGDGATTQFTLSSDPGNINNLDIAISGVTQTPGIDFTLSGTTLTFLSAPPAGTDNVFVRWGEALPQSVTEASAVNFTPGESGSAATDVRSWLRKEPVRVSQFSGADRTGVSVSTSALTAAISQAASAGKPLYIDGVYRIDAAVSFANVLSIFGDGPQLSGLIFTITSGVAFEFDNLAGSYDANVRWRDFFVQGPGKAVGTGVGMQVEGAVWTNSVVQNIVVSGFGSHGVYIKDCLTANLERVYSNNNGGDGFVIERSNGIRLYACMAESNNGKGYNWTNAGAAGEKYAPTMLACHAEENIGDAVFAQTTTGLQINGGWYQVASPSGATSAAAFRFDTTLDCRITSAQVTTGGTTTNLIGVSLEGAIGTMVVSTRFDQFAANRDVIANALSSRNVIAFCSGTGAQRQVSYTDANGATSTNVYIDTFGSTSNNGYEARAVRHSFRKVDGTEYLRVADKVQFMNHTTANSATAGGATALPATPTGYVLLNVNGTDRYFAYY